MSKIFQLLNKVISDIPGFTSKEELLSLYNLVYGTNAVKGDVVEIGSWCGRSSVVLEAANNTKTYCIDLFPELKDWRYNAENNTWSIKSIAYTTDHPIWNDTFNSRFLPVYNENLNLLDLFIKFTSRFTNKIISHKGDITSFLSYYPDIKVKFVFIDGNHDYEGVVKDIQKICPLIVSGGIVCIDDYNDSFYGVKSAVNECIVNSNLFTDKVTVTKKLFVARKI